MPAPTASVPAFSTPGICRAVRIPSIVVELDNRPRGVLAKHLLHDVALGEVTLNVLQREFLQFWNVILVVGSAPVRGGDVIRYNLIG